MARRPSASSPRHREGRQGEGGAVVSKQALTKAESDALVVTRKRDALVRRARRLLTYASVGAAELDDDGPVPEEWKTDRQWRVKERVARDARKSKRNAPAYLDMLQRIVENAERLEAAAKGGQPIELNVAIAVVQSAPPQYEVIDVTPTATGSKE